MAWIDDFNKLSPEEIEKTMNDSIDKMCEEAEEYDKQFILFKTSKEEDVMESIYKYLVTKQFIDDETVSYSPAEYPFSIEDFGFIFGGIQNYASKNYRCVDGDGMFSEALSFVKYKGTNISLRTISGQGTCCQMYTKDDEWDDTKSFTWEQYREDYKFDIMLAKKEIISKNFELFLEQSAESSELSKEEILKIVKEMF